MDPSEAVDFFGDYLSSAERWEILDLDKVYYVGQRVSPPSARLMQPPIGPRNGGWDDAEGFMILIPHDHIAYRYEVIKLLGSGTCSQVVKVWDHKSQCALAVKIIRNIPIFRHLADQEIEITRMLCGCSPHSLSKSWSAPRTMSQVPQSIIQILDHFVFREHPCLVFELLSMDLQTYMHSRDFQGFALAEVKQIARDILHGLEVLQKSKVVHSDLKPANIMFECPNPPSCQCHDLFKKTSSASLRCDTCVGLSDHDSAPYLCQVQPEAGVIKTLPEAEIDSQENNYNVAVGAQKRNHLDSGIGSATADLPPLFDLHSTPVSKSGSAVRIDELQSFGIQELLSGSENRAINNTEIVKKLIESVSYNQIKTTDPGFVRKMSHPNTGAKDKMTYLQSSAGDPTSTFHHRVPPSGGDSLKKVDSASRKVRCKSGSPDCMKGRRTKLIDFGCSTRAQFCRYLYVQSRFYRAPEVILAASYGCPIDMWSFGCLLAELITGVPLFAGETEEDQLALIIELCGVPPPELLQNAAKGDYYMSNGVPRYCQRSTSVSTPVAPSDDGMETYLVAEEPASASTPTSPISGTSRGFPGTRSWDSVLAGRKGAADPLLIDLLQGCLQWDPAKRLTPTQALAHPWLNIEKHESGQRPIGGEECEQDAYDRSARRFSL